MAWWNPLPAIGTAVSSIVKPIMEPINEWQERKTAVKKAEHAVEMALLTNKQRLAESAQSHNQDWEMEALKIKKRSPMQWVSFLVLGAPFIIAWFDPTLVAHYFTVSLVVIPEWYIKMFVSIIGVVWGISSLKNAAQGFSEFQMLRKEREHVTKVAQQVLSTTGEVTQQEIFKIWEEGKELLLTAQQVEEGYGSDYLHNLRELNNK